MRDRRPGWFRAGALVAVVVAVGCGAWTVAQEPDAPRIAQAAAPPAGEPSVPGVDLSPLNAAQKAAAMKIFREQRCDCSCGMTLVECRTKDQACGRSPQMAAQVVQLLAAGKTPDEVVKTVFSKPQAQAPSPAAGAAPAAPGAPAEMVFEVPTGSSYSVGPDSAPVTLVTWLDYQ